MARSKKNVNFSKAGVILSGHVANTFKVKISTSLIQVPNRLEESLRRIFDLLKLESNRRLAIKLVGEERFVILKIPR